MTDLRSIEERRLEAADGDHLDPGQEALSDPAAELRALRKEIDALDGKLLALLGARRRFVARVAAVKREQGLPAIDLDREATLLARLAARAELHGLAPDFVRQLFQAVIRSSCPLSGKSTPR